MDIEEWKNLSSTDQFKAWRGLNMYALSEKERSLLDHILEEFIRERASYREHGWGNVHGELQLVAKVDDSEVPKPFMGVPVRRLPGV